MRIALVLTVACLTGCIADDGEPIEDLGSLGGGKADKITTRNVTLRPRLESGAPSRRTFTVSTAESFRVSVGYDPDAATRIVVSDEDKMLVESQLTWQPTVVVPAGTVSRTLKIVIENAAPEPVTIRLHAATPEVRTLRVATFNIRWYGVGGNVDAPVPEGRNPALRAFMSEHLPDADMIVFEEILDVDMLSTEVLPAGWTCSTYTSNAPDHQFVVGCVAPGLALTREADDDDVGYQPLAFGTLRPGIAGIVRDVETRAPLARLMGVHLKATPASTDRRLEQAGVIGDRLASLATLGEQLPSIVIGDFNAHRAIDTKRDKDDWELIGDVLAQHAELGLSRVAYAFENTFRDKEAHAFKLDHLFLGGATASDVLVAGPCNASWETDRATIERHFDEISDHCPLIATVTLP